MPPARTRATVIRVTTVAAATIVLATSTRTWSADTSVAGTRLVLKAVAAKPDKRSVKIVLKDDAVGAPFGDPNAGARLTLSGGAAAGQCFADIELDAAPWDALGGDGAAKGWRYRPPQGEIGGIKKIVVKRGKVAIKAKGDQWPCALGTAQRLPVTVRFAIDADSYCAAFGDDVKKNEVGRFSAGANVAPAACPEKEDVTVTNLNILHGLFCNPDNCRYPDRVDLFFEWIVDAGCPDVVTLQEILSATVSELDDGIATACPFAYDAAHLAFNTVDDVVFLSRYPIVETEVIGLYKDFRNVARARIDHPIGPVDVFSTHLAASIDGANDPCEPGCPAECVTASAATVRECQAVQAAAFVESRHDVSTPAFLTGDFNAEPGDFEYLQAVGRGWLDSHLAAGNAECDLMSGIGCGSARDSSLGDLESTAVLVDERIDYIFVIPPTVGACTLEAPGDADGNGTTTGPWADAPNPFAPSCGASPDPICWPSDHNGNQADLDCD